MGRTYAAVRTRASRLGAQSYAARSKSDRGRVESAVQHLVCALDALNALDALDALETLDALDHDTVRGCATRIRTVASRLADLQRDLADDR